MSETLLLAILFGFVAALYGAVGHAGASGYLGVMALLGVAPAHMKPTALLLNVVVATIATVNFRRVGVFYPRQVLPLLVGSVPCAFLGGMVDPGSGVYRPLVGLVLVVAAWRALVRRAPGDEPAAAPRIPSGWAAMLLGAGIGLLAGLTGTGGGIFLSPLLVALGWATVRQSAGFAAPFILLNSLAGLAGSAATMPALRVEMIPLVLAVGVGGYTGSRLGAQRFPERVLSVALGLVLLVAAAKMLFT